MNRFHIFDMGGQRNERKKWIHCFENVTCVFFVAAISAYDQVLIEDEAVNRIEEALSLFENICNSMWFRQTPVILFLNKCDLFREKLATSPLNAVFPDYHGGIDYALATNFIEAEFLRRNHQRKPIYSHVTCATDVTKMRILFNGVKDTVICRSLHKAGLV